MSQSAVSHRLASPAEDDEIDLSELLGALWRGKFWILLCGFIAAVLGVCYALFAAVPVYTAHSSIVLESREQQVINIPGVLADLTADQSAVNTEVETLKSRELAERLVEDLDLASVSEFNEALRPDGFMTKLIGLFTGPTSELSESEILFRVTDTLREKITVSSVRQSYIFTITVTTENPERSAQIANHLARLYIAQQTQGRFDRAEQATNWLSNRVLELQAALDADGRQLSDFKRNSDLSSPADLEKLKQQLRDLRERAVIEEAALAADQARLADFSAARAKGLAPAELVALAQDRLLNSLLAQLQEGNNAAQTQFLNRLGEVERELQAANERRAAQLGALQLTIDELAARFNTQSEELLQLQDLESKIAASRAIYQVFLARMKEISVQQGLEQADSRIVSAAIAPEKPSAPRKSMIVALALALGLMIGAGLVLLRELRQNTFRAPEELERITGQAVLGTIPSIPSRNRSKILEGFAAKPNSPAAEAVRNLRTSLLLGNPGAAPQIIMLTSSLPGESKTMQSLFLAQSFAALGEKVLLIEGDLRRLTFGNYVDVQSRKGLPSVLSGAASLKEAAAHEPVLGGDLLIGEDIAKNPADIYSSPKFKGLLDDLRKIYDRIIIDASPVLQASDARIIGQFADAILYVVKWDQTSQRHVQDGVRSLATANLKPSGFVLAQADGRGMKRYGYGGNHLGQGG